MSDILDTIDGGSSTSACLKPLHGVYPPVILDVPPPQNGDHPNAEVSEARRDREGRAHLMTATLPTIVTLTNGASVVGEIVAPGLAITTEFDPDDGLNGYWCLTHVTSGMQMSQYSSRDINDLRQVARTVIAAGHNWDVPEPQLPHEARAVAVKALREMYEAGQQIQDHEAPFVLPAAAFDQPPPRG